MNIPLLDICALHAPILPELESALLRVLRSGAYINGEDVSLFENELAAAVHTPNAIGVSSGTDALLATLMAFDVRPGDKVITTPYTFFATAGAIVRLGAIPVFVDIEEEGFNIDVSQVEAAIDSRTVGIVPVHLFGATVDMTEICRVADAHGLWVVEDAAQAFGSCIANSRRAGTLGTAGIFSFFPAKNLGAAGDAGAVVTGDNTLATRIRQIRNHGAEPKYHHHVVGGNFRLDTLQAALLRVKLLHVEGWNAARQHAAARYDELLSDIEGITCPAKNTAGIFTNSPRPLSEGGASAPFPLEKGVRGISNRCTHVYNQYVVRFQNETIRNAAKAALLAHNIGCAVYYPQPLHLQPCFSHLKYSPGELPRSEAAAKTSLALPMHPTLQPADQQKVAEVLIAALNKASA
ncbi:MAG: DegT/DnrJ/EryC1/StrS family aminotransferase [Deltaproteobacteria bacterium]|nr:DegT/DnrJ/EryC1/StrS family aminotransferase [Deltaproteobacteria bacterium]MBN2670840.1 DegT/DnrJ/EryC1/StrS family aminotransferase [Deltaproteobacteria bacterium]